LLAKKPRGREDQNCANRNRRCLGTHRERQTQSCGKKKKQILVSSEPNKRIEPTGYAKGDDKIVLCSGCLNIRVGIANNVKMDHSPTFDTNLGATSSRTNLRQDRY